MSNQNQMESAIQLSLLILQIGSVLLAIGFMLRAISPIIKDFLEKREIEKELKKVKKKSI